MGDEMKEECQVKLNSLNISDDMRISQWCEKCGTGGCIQISCAKTITIGKNGKIDAYACGYSDGIGFGRATKEKSGGGYGTAGKGQGGGEVYGDKELTTLYLGSPGYDADSRGGGIIELI